MIFSIKVRHRHVRAVEFVCPRCGLDRVGTVSTPIRWVHVGRYPLAPLGEHDRVVTCAECDHMCDVGALSVPTTAQLTRLLDDAWLAALTQALQATAGPVDDDTLERERHITRVAHACDANAREDVDGNLHRARHETALIKSTRSSPIHTITDEKRASEH